MLDVRRRRATPLGRRGGLQERARCGRMSCAYAGRRQATLCLLVALRRRQLLRGLYGRPHAPSPRACPRTGIPLHAGSRPVRIRRALVVSRPAVGLPPGAAAEAPGAPRQAAIGPGPGTTPGGGGRAETGRPAPPSSAHPWSSDPISLMTLCGAAHRRARRALRTRPWPPGRYVNIKGSK
jgi:hypothetical protein